MPVLLLLLALLALLIFIVWERRRPGTPLTRNQMAKGWSLPARRQGPVWLGLGLMCAVMSLSQWLSPSLPPFSGRGAGLAALLHAHGGPQAIALAWATAALVLLVLGIVAWRQGR